MLHNLYLHAIFFYFKHPFAQKSDTFVVPWRILLLNNSPVSFFPFPVNDKINHILEVCRRCCSCLSEIQRVYYFSESLLFDLESTRFCCPGDSAVLHLAHYVLEFWPYPLTPPWATHIWVFVCIASLLGNGTCLMHAYWGTTLALHAFHSEWLLEDPIWGSYTRGGGRCPTRSVLSWAVNSEQNVASVFLGIGEAGMHTGLCSGSRGLIVIGKQRGVAFVQAC